MNRRNFLATLGLFTILPGAGRRWIKTSENLVVPNVDFVSAEYHLIIEPSMYRFLIDQSPGPFPFNVGETIRYSKTEKEGIISWRKELLS